MSEPFGFDHPEHRRRRTIGRRLGDRRVIADRRHTERRVELVPPPVDRRGGFERRSGFERRRVEERRAMESRRDSAWDGLDG